MTEWVVPLIMIFMLCVVVTLVAFLLRWLWSDTLGRPNAVVWTIAFVCPPLGLAYLIMWGVVVPVIALCKEDWPAFCRFR